MDIFSLMYPEFKFKKGHKIKMFEAFSGIGCQKMALERITDNFEIVGISEINKYAIQSYMEMHGETKNYGDISKIKGSDLKEIDIFTYSFPCTDLSKAGQQKGLNHTRSGLVYEVLRILSEMETKPKVLIMENVIDLVQTKFIKQFNEIQNELESLGYTNYTKTLIATDYGVAQTRERVFMVSILGEYYYKFPKPIPLEKTLKDYLEKDVSESYLLSKKTVNYLTDMTNRNGFVRGSRFNPRNENDIAQTITTRSDSNVMANYVITPYPNIAIPSATKDGYTMASDGDGVYLDRPHQKRGVVQKGMIQTIKTSGNDVGVYQGGALRKLTPRECWRLMDIDDHYYDKASQVCSNTQLYKQAGNGIVVAVFEAILRELIERKNNGTIQSKY